MDEFRLVDGYRIKSINKSLWLNVFHHNITNNVFFTENISTTAQQLSFINETDRFSILGRINHRYYINGVYNFLFHFPVQFPNDYFYFNQSNHPLYTTKATKVSTNFSPLIQCRLSSVIGEQFTGLTISAESSETYIDGNSYSKYWYYSIGARQPWSSLMAGPPCNDIPVSVTDLYIRIPNPCVLNDFLEYNFDNKCNIVPSVCVCSRYTNSQYLVMVFIFLLE